MKLYRCGVSPTRVGDPGGVWAADFSQAHVGRELALPVSFCLSNKQSLKGLHLFQTQHLLPYRGGVYGYRGLTANPSRS